MPFDIVRQSSLAPLASPVIGRAAAENDATGLLSPQDAASVRYFLASLDAHFRWQCAAMQRELDRAGCITTSGAASPRIDCYLGTIHGVPVRSMLVKVGLATAVPVARF